MLRVNAGRVPVECGAAAEVVTDGAGVRARVLPNGQQAGARLAAVIAVETVQGEMRETLKVAASERLKHEFEALRQERERLRERPHDREAHRRLRERLAAHRERLRRLR